MGLADYKTHANIIIEKVNCLFEIANKLNMKQGMKISYELLSHMKLDTFHLLIVGEFSRGKSTFVNALLGRKILPASKNPTTAIISKIVYGEKPDYRICYHEEEPRQLTEDEFIKLTAPKEPDEDDAGSMQEYIQAQEDLARIDYAEITYPLSFCQNGVEVVDTPGTNDLNTMRLDITYGYLAQADAVVLLLSATQPLSASEAEFLKERILGNQIQDIFFVISRKDELDGPEQEQSVIDFITENLRKILPKEVSLKNRIFLVGSRGALFYHMQEQGEKLTMKQEMEVPEDFADTGFPAFEAALTEFLTEEKGMVRLRKYRREALAIIRNMQSDLSKSIVIAAHSADEIRQKAKLMEVEFGKAGRQAEKIVLDMRLALSSEATTFDYKCQQAGQAILEAAKSSVQSLRQDMSSSAMRQVIERAAVKEKKRFLDTALQECQQVIEREMDTAQQKLGTIWQDIDIAYKSNFNLPDKVEKKAELEISDPEKSFTEIAYAGAESMFKDMFRENKSITDRVLSGLGAAIASGAGLISELWSMFSGGAKSDWRDSVRSQVFKAYGQEGERLKKSFRRQYEAKVEDLCQQVQDSVDSRIKDMEAQLKAILREKEVQEEEAGQQQKMLEEKREELRKLSRELEQQEA